ncbi:MAG: DNA repair protein RecN [Planctomycetota bacterium]
MLQSLHIRDLALVASAELHLDDGLNVLSGATGGGKSLVLGALELLRGERARGDLVRHGQDELRVDAEFVLGSGERTAAARRAVREVIGQELEEDVLLVSRIVDRRGRSRVRIDGRPATLRDLRTLSEHLVEIHRQGETRSLMRAEIQAETLDAFGDLAEQRRAFASALRSARSAVECAEQARGDAELDRERADLCRARLAEFEAVGLVEGELQQLEDEHRVLANLDALRADLSRAAEALSDGEPSASELVGEALRALEAAGEVDASMLSARDQVTEARVHIEEAARTAQSRLGDLEFDPGRFAFVEERLGTVRRALDRHGPTEEEYFARAEQTQEELDRLDGGDSSPEALEKAIADSIVELESAAETLDAARREVSAGLREKIEAELADLAMADACFRVAMPEELPAGLDLVKRSTVHGPVPVDFEVQLNPGEPFTPMRDTASGGETARIVLAVKKCLADQDRVPLIVFDEIDSEVGGRLGQQIGEKLKGVAAHHQVLIVTHLPQVAAFADAHFKVEKVVEGGRTTSSVERLEGAAIDRELEAMAGGAEAPTRRATSKTRATAKKGSTPKKPSGA